MTLKQNIILLDSFILSLVIFTVDLQIELGVAGGVPYMACVLMCMWIPKKRAVLLMALICSVFTVFGYFFLEKTGFPWKAVANRCLALFAIWSTTVVCILKLRSYKHMQETSLLLKQANEELNQFADVVSHDIRAPLRAIRGYANFINEDLSEKLKGEVKQHLDGLMMSTSEAEDIVSGVLTLSRIENKEEFYLNTDIKQITEDVIKSYKNYKDVSINYPEKTICIHTIPILFKQVLMNLIQNGLKFNVKKKKIIDINWETVNESCITLSVKDNGIGIDKKFHQHIFTPFRRLHDAKEYEGMGMGMAIVKKAIVKLKGKISLESEKNKGCQFTITLPVDIRS